MDEVGPPTMRINPMKALFLDTIAAVFATGTLGFWLDRSLVSVGHNSISLCRSTERPRCDFERLYLEKSPGNLWDWYSFCSQYVFFGIVISMFFLEALQCYEGIAPRLDLASK